MLVLPQAGAPRALHRHQERVQQEIVQVEVLVGHEAEQVQVPLRVRPAGDLEDFRLDDRLGVIAYAVGRQIKGPQDGAERLVESADRLQVGEVFFDL